MYIIEGIPLGMIYALVAVGYSLIFSILGIINFSHGSIYAFGAMMAYFLSGVFLNPWIAMVVSMVLTGILAICVNKFSIEPLRKKNAPHIATLITTIGVSYTIQHMLIAIFGSNRVGFEAFYDWGFIDLGTYRLYVNRIVLFVASSILMLVLTLFIKKTRTGFAIRAIQQNYKAAKLMGINEVLVIGITFFLAGISASFAGTMVAGYYRLAYPSMGVMVGNKTFAAALLGGLGEFEGCIIGGLVIGVLETIVAGLYGAAMKDAVAFIILIAIMVFKPNGIFGKKVISKV